MEEVFMKIPPLLQVPKIPTRHITDGDLWQGFPAPPWNFYRCGSLCMFGNLFTCEEGRLTLRFAPVLPEYLVGEERRVEAVLLGHTKVVYEMKEKKDYFPGGYRVDSIELCYRDESRYETKQGVLTERRAVDLRQGKVSQVNIKLS